MEKPTLILASTSPRRQELIRLLGFPVEIMPSEAEEHVEADWTPEMIVERLSLRKAMAVREKIEPKKGGFIVGSDTIVVLEGRVLGKPRDAEEAQAMLSMLQGRDHKVFTGAALVDCGADIASVDWERDPGCSHGAGGRYRTLSTGNGGISEVIVGHTVNKVTFRSLTAEEIEGYVRTGDPLDKAGAYGVQGAGAVFVNQIEGDFYSIMGLPLSLLYSMLKKLGIHSFGAPLRGFNHE